MVNRKTLFLLSLLVSSAISAQTTMLLQLASDVLQNDAPVVIDLAKYGSIKSAVVLIDGKEVPCQLDDLDKDGKFDELAFVTDFTKKGQQAATITLYDNGKPREYQARTFAELVLRNPNVKEKNKQDIYLSSITIDRKTANPYNVLHHHGVAFENELIAMRIYMDKRQTIDLYGKFRKGLELEQTQFYTSKEQKAEGYGDDVLWVGNTFGLGALRGWNGHEPTMLDDVEQRTQRIICYGPVRTIVEVEDAGWRISPSVAPVDMVIRYTLYAGHRDFDVDVAFNRDMSNHEFSTGMINVKNSSEYSDKEGLRGCWGTDWPATDTINWKRETVGLGIYIPSQYNLKEIAADKNNYTFVVRPIGNKIHYNLAYTSANESFGYHSGKEWFEYLKEWKKRESSPVTIKQVRVRQHNKNYRQ